MSEGDSGMKHVERAPEAKVQTKRSFSIIWVVPIIALLIGGWLTFKAMSEKGPEITITFETADGLVAGKTSVKFKDVDVGKVTKLELNDDASGVVATVEMTNNASSYLTDKTQFWVVRATVAAGEISGLGTLLSGAYIGCNPSTEGKKQTHYKGLEKPPILTADLPGRHFVLKSKELGSLDLGSPIYYRGIKVGQVVDYDFDETAEAVLFKVFIRDPFHKKVTDNTRFWNASGVDFTMDATGIKMDTQSLVSIMLGGVAFDLPEHAQQGEQAEEDKDFLLYEDRDASNEVTYNIKQYYLMYFNQSVRGLSPGAPVEILGIKVGEVVKVELLFDQTTLEFLIPVLVYFEPERLNLLITEEGKVARGTAKAEEIEATQKDKQGRNMVVKELVARGFRAQLKTGNLLTGQLFVDLANYPDAPPKELMTEQGYTVFPTIPAPFEQIVNRVDNILKKFEKVPFDKIGMDLQLAVESLPKPSMRSRICRGTSTRRRFRKSTLRLTKCRKQ
ncbi:MAG: MlaD family protein [Desulfuromonadales bacterium]|nr:MlaD family protein [Desulfuromonadales bacterium]